MGIIKRQGIKQTLVTYVGVFIGLVATLYIYPLEEGMYGLARFLLSMAAILYPILSLGVESLTVRFFPEFRDKETGHHGFLGILFIFSSLSFFFFGILLFYFRDSFYHFLAWLKMDVEVFSKNLLETGILVFFIISSAILTSYISNFKRIAIPGIFNSLFLKIGLPCLILLYYFQRLQTQSFKIGFIIIHVLIFIALLIYTWKLGELHLKPHFGFLSKDRLKRMAGYSLFGMFSGLGANLAFRIDAIMTASLLNFQSTGIYGIADNIANIIISPYRSIIQISAPIVAQEMHDKNYSEVDKLYKSSSISLTIIGVGLLVAAYVSIDDLFQLSPKYETLILSKQVVLLLGIGKIVNMATSLNAHIISYSKYFKVNLYLTLLLAGLNIYLNLTLIPLYQIVGAAMATFISLSLFNILKLLFVWSRFRMQPLNLNHLWVLLFGLLAYGIGAIMPDTGYILINIILKSGSALIIFGGLALYFNLSPDITQLVRQIIKKIKI